jgi:DNA-binding Lrp family transcriptional regulator
MRMGGERMVVPFYMLIHTKKGQAFLTVQEAQKIEGIKIAHSVMGSYDVIIYAEANDLPDLRRIREAVCQISAVTRTETAVHT